MIVFTLEFEHNPSLVNTERILATMQLTPAIATVIFVLACLSGYQYRRVWKAEGPRWQLWLYGLIAASGLLFLGFVPLDTGD